MSIQRVREYFRQYGIENRIMEFENGRLIDKMGTYEDYIAFRREQA